MASDRLPAPIRRASNVFGSFTPGQKAVTIAAIIALVIGGYFFATWASKPAYGTLFNNLSSKDASAIVESLQGSGTPYELANGGQTILVPQDQVYDLRLQLSGEGLPGEADTGYALLDEQGITVSDFMQHVGYQRAIEGELSNTIKSIDGVDAATVHLVLPQKDVFSDDQSKTTASVLVASKATGGLTGDQVQAIVHLVASSVEGLEPDRVTVVGADGRMLSTGGGIPGGMGTGTDDRAKKTAQYQDALSDSLQRMLDAVVGPGHAVVNTNAVLDFDQTDTQTETYAADPTLPALSEDISKEAYNGGPGAATGVLGPDNIAVPNTGPDGAGQYTSTKEVRNSALNKTLETRKAAPGAVKRLGVTVLLDSTVAGAVNVADMQRLVGVAAGIDATRGDTIAVGAMPFDTSAATAAKDALAAAGAAEKQQAQMSLIKTGALVLIVLILMFLAWRASRRAKKRTKLSAGEMKHLEDMQAALEMQRLAELNGMIPAAIDAGAAADAEAREGRKREIEQMVEDQPEEVAALLRGWLGAGR